MGLKRIYKNKIEKTQKQLSERKEEFNKQWNENKGIIFFKKGDI
jgi:hypothetical protein